MSSKLAAMLNVVLVLFSIVGCEASLEVGGYSPKPDKDETLTETALAKPVGHEYTNSIGMKFVRIEPGSFLMGEYNTPMPIELTKPLSYPRIDDLRRNFPQGDPDKFQITTGHVRNGDYDEKPVHRVTISKPLYMGVFEVTNAQYEKFDPSHRALRGKRGFSKEDDEAVVFVSWYEAKAFCEWLSQKEGLPYRLPTEAEWEYACRAGTTTLYWTGNELAAAFEKNTRRTQFSEAKDIVPLFVGRTPPNPWGLYDMHGNVEEWCYDWYGPYKAGEQTDPVGYADGDFKVTRGGSHGTNLYYLRSANRMGTLPENKHWLIGLRVVIGKVPATKPLPVPSVPANQRNVSQQIPADVTKGPDPDKPYFKGPRKYVKIAEGSVGPLFAHHNHDAGITECPNGDLLAIWYTCVEERGRELAVAASRLRYGAEQWEPASPFWDTPDRNDHCPAIWYDGKDTLYHFNGLSVAGMWSPLAIVMRTSKNNGASWSKARIIAPEHGFRNMVGEPVFRTAEGAIVFGADVSGRCSTVWVSWDNGQTWKDAGGRINGIHAGIVQLKDGCLMALGRENNIDGWMPKSISCDMGKTWTASATHFAPISGGQRLVLMRLKEGPLFMASFAADVAHPEPVPDGIRSPRYKAKLFGALSFDDGQTWPVRRVISDCRDDHQIETFDGAPALMNPNNSEALGYLSVCQGLDGVIHLISSINEYAFNIAWLKQEPPKSSEPAHSKELPVRRALPYVYDASRLPGKAPEPWQFVVRPLDEDKATELKAGGVILLNGQSKIQQRWSNERGSDFYNVDTHQGFAAEAAVQVTESSGEKGFVFALYGRGGTLTVNQYLISVTRTGVYYWYDKKFVKLAEGLDNYSRIHRYRVAVRGDTVAQVYRDGKLLGIGLVDLRIDWAPPARGSYIEWGLGTSEAEALLDYISYDIDGPSQPVSSER